MTQPGDSAPHERVVDDHGWTPCIPDLPERKTSSYDNTLTVNGACWRMEAITPDDWPDEDGPVTATERWALAQIRAVPHGSVVVHKRDGEIKRVEKCWSEVAPEGR